MHVYFAFAQSQEMAVFLAQLLREGVAWVVRNDVLGWEIELTGF